MNITALNRTLRMALALAIVLAGCSSSESSARKAAPKSSPGSTSAKGAVTPNWTPQTQHASDGDAPAVPMPEGTPRPYGPSPIATADPAFYDLEGLAPKGPLGTVLRREVASPLVGSLAGFEGERVLYSSTTGEGTPTIVSGMIIRPNGPTPPGGWPIAAWAHGTTGIADRCAPSSRGDLFYEIYAAEAKVALDAGYVVAATDYIGLGTQGVHTYLKTDDLGRATIDMVRAAHRENVFAKTRSQWIAFGHSEGGQAVLAADAMVPTYAKGLEYLGGISASPSVFLEKVAAAGLSIPDRGYIGLLLEARAVTDPRVDPGTILGPKALERRSLLTRGCWEDAVPGFSDMTFSEFISDPEIGALLTESAAPWVKVDPTQGTGPLMIVNGTEDESAIFALTEQWVQEHCDAGFVTTFYPVTGSRHDEVLAKTATEVTQFLKDRREGVPPPTSCQTITIPANG
ncbi:MAG: lipase family protein [Acidimicrobiia bacterium]